MVLGSAGILRLPRYSHGFAFVQCANPAGLGLKSRESRGDGIGHLRESHRVDGGCRRSRARI